MSALPVTFRGPAGESRHARRFRTAILVLSLAGTAAVVAAIVLVLTLGTRSTSSGQWSIWKPPDAGLTGAQDIADYLSPYYRASSADQLAVVTALNLNNPANPVQIVIPSSQGGTNGLVALPASSTIAYNLCGVQSTNCSIGVGTASSARLLLLRREALELALYTFKYLSGVQTVVAILPPGHTIVGCTGLCPSPHAKTSQKPLDLALAFDRAELQPWLDRPLDQTLPEPLPPTISQMDSAPEAELVSVITAHGLFQAQTEQAQDGSNMIVLNPLPAQ